MRKFILASQRRLCGATLTLVALAVIAYWQHPASSQSNTVSVVSAASYAPTLAPGAIAAAFGTRLATSAESAQAQPLPTKLAGTTVRVNDELAPLLFVSPGQINFLIPPTTATGAATIIVTAGDGATSTGIMQVSIVAPAIFTANASGGGVPAAQALRIKNDNSQSYEPVAIFDAVAGAFKPKAIELGNPGERVYLILYLTGVRRAGNSEVKLVLGGQKLPVEFVGAAPGFAGLEQINVFIPPEFADSGMVSFAISVAGQLSNLVDVEFCRPSALVITSLSPDRVRAGQPVTIRGSGFAPRIDQNSVRFLGNGNQADAQLISASLTELTVQAPFGVESGALSVTNRIEQGGGVSQTVVTVVTSVSGFFKDTTGQKLQNVKITIIDAAAVTQTAVTNAEGAFVIYEVAPGPAIMKVDGENASTSPFPAYTFKQPIRGDRDNQLDFPGSLQAINGSSSAVSNDGQPYLHSLRTAAPTGENAPAGKIVTGDVVLDIPDNAIIRFPDGTPVPRITLSLVSRSLTPVALPLGHFSSTIVQISPLGALITPGVRLTFPNSDGFAANSRVKLFRLAQQRNDNKLGSFIDAGEASVSDDGKQIVTSVNAVTETTYYFASMQRQTVTLVGQVLDADQIPVRRALLGARGQSIFTDGSGQFYIPQVPLNMTNTQIAEGAVVTVNRNGQAVVGAETILVEANLHRPTKIVSRREVENVTPSSNIVITLPAPPPNTPPTIQAVDNAPLRANQSNDLEIVVTPGGGLSVEVFTSGVNFPAIVLPQGDGLYVIRLSPRTSDIGNQTLIITAQNDLGQTATKRVVLAVQ